MNAFALAVDQLLDLPLLQPWGYTIGRAVLLLALLITFWQVRRFPWLWAGLGIAGLLLTLRVMGDVGTDGANTPYTVYLLGSNVAALLLYIGVAQMAHALSRLRAMRRERDVARAQRDAARLWVQNYQARLSEPITEFPEEDR